MASKSSAIDTKLIRELADLINETDLNEIEVEEGDLRIRLARGQEVTMMHAPAAPVAAAPLAAPAPVAAAAPTAAPVAASTNTVTSPMVGTAYLSPAPGADAFIAVGQTIKKGDTILIIEAMKTMNQIASTKDGVVAEIAVEDGQPVEFGQVLITLQ